MDELYVTLEELIEATGIPRATLDRRLKALGIEPERRVNGSGRPKNYYPISDLPDDWQLKVNIKRNEKHLSELKAQGLLDPPSLVRRGRPRKGLPVPVSVPAPASASNLPAISGSTALISSACSLPASWEGLKQEKIDRVFAEAHLVGLYREHYGKAQGWGSLGPAREQFVSAYNLGDAGAFPELFRIIGPVGRSTLDAWDHRIKVEGNDCFALADRRGKWRKGQRAVTEAQGKILAQVALSPNAPLIAEVIRRARDRMALEGIPCETSDDTLRRFLGDYKKANLAKWTAVRQGHKAVNDKLVYHMSRDYDAIEVGDILFCDGHVFNAGSEHPDTGKEVRMMLVTWFDMKSSYPVGWEISPTENTQAVATALYRAILCLGKLPKVAYLDNGKAFRSRFFNGVDDLRKTPLMGAFQLLGMEKIFAWAYHGESKTQERWHRTLAELERELSSYRGTSIDLKVPRLMRGEKLHVALYQAITGGKVPSTLDLHRDLADWVDRYAGRPQRGHLKGMTPQAVFDAGRGPGFTEDEARRLRLLLMTYAVRSIHRDGIKMPWSEQRFYHPGLYGRAGQPGIVRFDELDRDRVWVYDTGNRFICEASRMRAVHPAARVLGSEADQEELKRQIELKRHLEKQTFGQARAFVEAVVVPEMERREAAKEEERREALKAGEKISVKRAVEAPPMTEAEARRIQAEFEAAMLCREEERAAEEAAKGAEADLDLFAFVDPEPAPELSFWEQVALLPDMDRYEKDIESQVKGMLIPQMEQAWMSYFEKTPEYGRFMDYFEQHKRKMALMYGAEKEEQS